MDEIVIIETPDSEELRETYADSIAYCGPAMGH